MVFRDWLAGRKTYLLAAVLVQAVLVLVFLGRLTPETAAALGLLAASGFAVTFRSALERHQAEEIALLQDVARAGGAVAVHNNAALVSDVVKTVEDGIVLAAKVNEEKAS
jgi:hypothetical protein